MIVCGPTGCAAFNAGGTTCHRFFGISSKSLLTGNDPSHDTSKQLLQKLQTPIMLIVDEQSMIEAKVVALMEQQCQKFTYRGQCTKLPWGGFQSFFLLVMISNYLP